MLFATAGQGALMVWMMAAGAVMGLVYLLFAALRRLIQAGFVLTLISDLACGVICAAVFIAFLVRGNYGRVRMFEILAAALGMGMCILALQPGLKWLVLRLGGLKKRIWTALSGNRLIKVIFR